MHITYDASVDAAYLYLTDDRPPGFVKRTQSVNENINIDYNSEDIMVGIEVLAASSTLSPEVLEAAEKL